MWCLRCREFYTIVYTTFLKVFTFCYCRFFCFSKSSSFLSCEVCVTTWVFWCHPSFLPHVTRLEIKEPELFPSSKNSSTLFFCLPIHHGASSESKRRETTYQYICLFHYYTHNLESWSSLLLDEGFLWFSDNSVTWILKA